MRLAATLLFATTLLAMMLFVRTSFAGMSDLRTLVVHGRVLAADGSPVAGARVSTRGGATIAAVSDDRGRYTLSVSMGSVAGLKRGPFALEVRAERDGRRLAFGAGASALALEVSLVPGNVVRLRSNSSEAMTSLASAFAMDGLSTAWVEADFGGSARPSGEMDMKWTNDVRLDGGPAPATTGSAQAPEPAHAPRADTLPRGREQGTPNSPAPAAPAGAAPLSAIPPTAGAAASRESIARVQQDARLSAASRDSIVRAQRAARALAKHQAAFAKARRDSARVAQAERLRASRDSARTATASIASAAPSDTARRESAAALAPHLEPPAPAPPPKTTRALSTPPRPETQDTCACRLRGTVEIDWDRPLDRNFPVELSLEGPARQSTQVDMFMGSPREYRFGPLPCGDYHMVVSRSGRWHFTFERGDTVLSVPCHGLTQTRVILVPAKR